MQALRGHGVTKGADPTARSVVLPPAMVRLLMKSVVVLGLTATAVAGPYKPGTWLGTRRVAVVTPTEGFTPMDAPVTPIIYVNRCSGGCSVMGGTVNDAQSHTATVPPGPHTLTEFQNDAGQVGAAADAEFAEVVKCLREVYSPFNITIVDTKPVSGYYTELMVAGV